MERILESIAISRARGATVRVGPELEIPGYGCLDHFLEGEGYFFCRAVFELWTGILVLLCVMDDDDDDGYICR